MQRKRKKGKKIELQGYIDERRKYEQKIIKNKTKQNLVKKKCSSKKDNIS